MKKKLLLPILLTSIIAFSQQKKVNLIWGEAITIATEGYVVQIPSFAPKERFDFSLDRGVEYVEQWDVNTPIDENSVSIANVVYSPMTKLELKGIDVKTIPNEIAFTLKNSIARDKLYAMLRVSGIVRTANNTYKKVRSFTINYNHSNKGKRFNTQNRLTISNSILSTGTWYKFAINKSGVFRLSKNYLNNLGINTNAIDPRNIKIYGNGGKMLPYRNNVEYPIDPEENAIKVIGEEDGVFNDGDYVLFYGDGPKANVEDPSINTNINSYSDIAYYYINVSAGTGKRIQEMNQSTGTPDMIIDTFQDYQFHEVDETNLAFVGRRWFGDEFDVETSKTFEFNFPDLVTTSPIKLKVIGASTSANDSNMAVSLNNTQVGMVIIPAVTDPNFVSEGFFVGDVNAASDDVTIKIDYDKLGNPSAVGYLDYISVEATRSLTFNGKQYEFKNNETAQAIGIGQYNVSNASGLSEVWNITDLNNVSAIVNNDASATLSFKTTVGTLKTFVTVSTTDFYEPLEPSNSTVANQNIKGTIFENSQGNFQDIDYLIITPATHLVQAERLAQINRVNNGLVVRVLTIESIYAEFSTSNEDIAAIRNLVKYVYDNASTPDKRVKYLCLFGDSSFDYKGRISSNTYNMPTWNAYNSFNLTNSFVSDDFFGMMDENEGNMESTDKLDIATGRIIADTPLKAKQMVDKVATYYSREAFGSWRNNFVVISDDVDEPWESSLQETTDQIGDQVTTEKPFINVVKIHADSFQQESSVGGDRYPEVKTAISNAIENGALVVNYFGHGGEDGFAFERFFQKPDAESLRNECQLNCFVTVTCEYTKFDNPLRETAGELIYWNKDGGAISLITTTRQIFVSVGITFNLILEEYLFSFNDTDDYEDHEYPTAAEALRLTKNDPAIAGINQKNLVFYIGDPAMRLAFPEPNVRLTKINDVPVAQSTDVLEALSYAKLGGEVTDVSGNILSNYNGVVTTTIYDKPIQRQTLGNDNVTENGQVIILDYETLGAVVFRGQASVVNGEFEFDFIVPRDIGIPVGYGKVSFYASTETPLSDQTGATTNTLQIGGLNENAPEDNVGPVINLFMNDENFVFGGVTNESPNLLVKLQDENGINTASGIGHDIVAILDGDEVNPFILNNYYTTEIDDYTRGSLSFPFRDLEPGIHTLSVKAWDVYNNSSIAELQFVVFNENDHLIVNNVLNYPNPFVNYTEFWFSHNSSEILDISVQIFTVSGKLVRTLNGQSVGDGGKSSSSTSRDIVWDGRDDFGDKIGKGTYIYKLKVHSSATNKTVEKIEKLVIL